MPNLNDIRKRVRSVKNTQKITGAMKMVAAARLRRAQIAAVEQRPYGRKMGEVLGALASHATVASHPLFAANDSKVTVVVVVTSDRGLCGGFNTNLHKRVIEVVAQLTSAGQKPQLYTIGKKGRDFFRRRDYTILKERINVASKLDYGDAKIIADDLMERFSSGAVGQVVIVYSEFLSIMRPQIQVETLLPVPAIVDAEAGSQSVDYEFEPNPKAIFDSLVPWHVRTQVFRVLRESIAAELAARMTAMDAATTNAGEMIDALTLFMNKVRQAAITRELLEVVAGAAALEH